VCIVCYNLTYLYAIQIKKRNKTYLAKEINDYKRLTQLGTVAWQTISVLAKLWILSRIVLYKSVQVSVSNNKYMLYVVSTCCTNVVNTHCSWYITHPPYYLHTELFFFFFFGIMMLSEHLEIMWFGLEKYLKCIRYVVLCLFYLLNKYRYLSIIVRFYFDFDFLCDYLCFLMCVH
jgi:hypothetical protein